MTIHLSIPDYLEEQFKADVEAIKLGRGLPDDAKAIRYAVEQVADIERAK